MTRGLQPGSIAANDTLDAILHQFFNNISSEQRDTTPTTITWMLIEPLKVVTLHGRRFRSHQVAFLRHASVFWARGAAKPSAADATSHHHARLYIVAKDCMML
ncbi:hypothetical protein [Ralstonia pseudosolanacearum]|nr:hypothetical protein [Ralstonia pseudosolanacearum]